MECDDSLENVIGNFATEFLHIHHDASENQDQVEIVSVKANIQSVFTPSPESPMRCAAMGAFPAILIFMVNSIFPGHQNS